MMNTEFESMTKHTGVLYSTLLFYNGVSSHFRNIVLN